MSHRYHSNGIKLPHVSVAENGENLYVSCLCSLDFTQLLLKIDLT